MEIVTGKAGTPHVSSADDGRRIAGEVGTGSYILKTGGGLAPSLVDANTVRFATGDMVVQGRHIGLTAPEDVKVASGTQGKKRTDYICVHYKRDVSGANPTLVEKVEWKVLQGTPGATATAPSLTSGSILNGDADVTVPVCSVSFDGLTTGAPKLIIPTLTPLATLGDSVSQCTRLWYRDYNTSVEPSAVTFTAPGGLDSYDYLVFFGKTNEWKRASAMLSKDNGFDNQYFQLTAPYAPNGGTDIYERMTGYTVTFSGESVTVSPQWYNEVHFSMNGCDTSTGKGIPLYEVLGIKRLS